MSSQWTDRKPLSQCRWLINDDISNFTHKQLNISKFCQHVLKNYNYLSCWRLRYHLECFDIWPRTFGASLCTVELLSGSTIQYSFCNFKSPPPLWQLFIYLFDFFKALFALHVFILSLPSPATPLSLTQWMCVSGLTHPLTLVGLSHPPTRLKNRKVMESLIQLIPDAIILSFRQTKIKTRSLVHVVPQSRKFPCRNEITQFRSKKISLSWVCPIYTILRLPF